jgi:unsaturated rhamnogalacturonyl hydrolase
MKTAVLLAILAAGCATTNVPQTRAFSDAVERSSIAEVLSVAADWQIAHRKDYPPHDEWAKAPFYIGLVAFAPVSKNPQRYLDAARREGQANHWRPGLRPLAADDHAITQSYFMLHAMQPDQNDRTMIQPTLYLFDAVVRYPHDESLEFEDWEKTFHQWTWCDALFMSPPALALATKATGDRRYIDFMNRMWWKVTDFLYDKEEHLYYRDSRFFSQRSRNGKKVFWSRGNGWVLAGLARVLQAMPPDYPDRPRYVRLFQEMAPKIASLQLPDGYWRSSLLDPESTPHPETSGTGFYIYALTWGVNNGLLDRPTYEPIIRKGWSALVRAVHPDGMLGNVQKIGDQPENTSADDTEIYGTGALLLAGSEVYKLAN